MKKILSILLFFLLIDICFGYIDPGTGGYLLSSLWSWIVGIFTVLFAVIIRFFKYKVFVFIRKYRVYLFVFSLIFVVTGIYISFFNNSESNYLEFNSSKIGGEIFNEDKVLRGYNLYNGLLVDLKGNVIKNYSYKYLGVYDKDGNYYAQECYECLSFGKFDFQGNLIWKKDIPIHHEIYIDDNNSELYVMSKKMHIYNERKVEFDTILKFDFQGNFIESYSTYKHLSELQKFHKKLELDSKPNKILPENHKKNESIWGAEYDYYHMNSFSLVPENNLKDFHPAFKPGNWIFSFRHGSMTFIIDKDTKKVLWSGIYDQIKDNLEGQHIARMNENGNVRIFDNGRYRGWSRIVEINPVDLTVVSEIKFNDFFTSSQGYFQDLPNGNILIVESEKGRVFEIDQNQDIVWEFYNPSKKNQNGELIHEEIYRMYRYEEKFINNLLGFEEVK